MSNFGALVEIYAGLGQVQCWIDPVEIPLRHRLEYVRAYIHDYATVMEGIHNRYKIVVEANVATLSDEIQIIFHITTSLKIHDLFYLDSFTTTQNQIVEGMLERVYESCACKFKDRMQIRWMNEHRFQRLARHIFVTLKDIEPMPFIDVQSYFPEEKGEFHD
jgi:hypothetical protein